MGNRFNAGDYDLSEYVYPLGTNGDEGYGMYIEFDAFRQDYYEELIDNMGFRNLPFGDEITFGQLEILQEEHEILDWNKILDVIDYAPEYGSYFEIKEILLNSSEDVVEPMLGLIKEVVIGEFPDKETLRSILDEALTELGAPIGSVNEGDYDFPEEYSEFYVSPEELFDEYALDSQYFQSTSNVYEIIIHLEKQFSMADDEMVQVAIVFAMFSTVEAEYKRFLLSEAIPGFSDMTFNDLTNDKKIHIKSVVDKINVSVNSRQSIFKTLFPELPRNTRPEEPGGELRNAIAHGIDSVRIEDTKFIFPDKYDSNNTDEVEIEKIIQDIKDFAEQITELGLR